MRSVRILPAARADLLEIWQFIARDSVNNASRVTDAIEREIRGLAEFPGKGHGRADVNDQRYRFWSVFSYLIAYRFDDESLTVVRVIHGRRDVRRFFKR